MPAEFIGRIGGGKRRRRDRYTQKPAERIPAFGNLVDQQAIVEPAVLHRCVMSRESRNANIVIVEGAAEMPGANRPVGTCG